MQKEAGLGTMGEKWAHTSNKGEAGQGQVELPHLWVVVLCLVLGIIVQVETVESVGLALLAETRAHWGRLRDVRRGREEKTEEEGRRRDEG